MTYTLENIASIIGGKIVDDNYKSVVIKDLLFDSRLLANPEGTLFFSLKSNRNDGSKYIEELYNKGVRCFVVEDNVLKTTDYKCGVSFIIVDDTLKALQKLTAYHRNNFNIPVVGITGGAMTANEFVNGPLYIQGDHSDADFRNMVLTPLN